MGRLVLGGDGSLQIEAPGTYEPVWRSSVAAAGARTFVLTDEGDFELLDGERVRRLNSRTGRIEAVPLGERAPVADITGDRFLLREGRTRRPWSGTRTGRCRSPSTARASAGATRRGAVLWREGMDAVTPVPPPARQHAYGGAEPARGGRPRHQSLTSASGAYTLVRQDDGNLVLYGGAEHRAVWATDTWWAAHRAGRTVLFGEDGRSRWHSSTAAGERSVLALGDDGVLRVHAGDGTAVEEPAGPGDELFMTPGAVTLRRAT